MKKVNQMSESIQLGIILALTGGFMDAYSYLCRDHVFANAQTGNMLLLGINISEGKWSDALRYLLPVLAFTVGIALADVVRVKMNDKNLLHWRQISALFEAIVLALVSFFSQDMNLLANSLTSLACGIQVESFRKIRGSGIATTMCIGNLRNATQNICEYYHTKDRSAVEKGMLYYGIIGCFIIGAVIGNVMIKLFAEKAILVCTATMFLAFCLMFIDKEKAVETEADDVQQDSDD
jgi:uncharacterized membrane protein YoaK (UPF0700 family)